MRKLEFLFSVIHCTMCQYGIKQILLLRKDFSHIQWACWDVFFCLQSPDRMCVFLWYEYILLYLYDIQKIRTQVLTTCEVLILLTQNSIRELARTDYVLVIHHRFCLHLQHNHFVWTYFYLFVKKNFWTMANSIKYKVHWISSDSVRCLHIIHSDMLF